MGDPLEQRIVELVARFGYERVAAAVERAKPPRIESRPGPKGPRPDLMEADMGILTIAARRWQEGGKGAVWPVLMEAARQGRSHAVRLQRRLKEMTLEELTRDDAVHEFARAAGNPYPPPPSPAYRAVAQKILETNGDLYRVLLRFLLDDFVNLTPKQKIYELFDIIYIAERHNGFRDKLAKY
jgi:hypothetical protein